MLLTVQEKLAKLAELVQQNLSTAQKIFYERNARDKDFNPLSLVKAAAL